MSERKCYMNDQAEHLIDREHHMSDQECCM